MFLLCLVVLLFLTPGEADCTLKNFSSQTLTYSHGYKTGDVLKKSVPTDVKAESLEVIVESAAVLASLAEVCFTVTFTRVLISSGT